MLRYTLLCSAVLLLNACGAGGEFCESDAQCPAGATLAQSREALPANYGHLCMKSDDCADLPDTGCQYVGNGYGACWFVRSQCPAGTVGPFYDPMSAAGCAERCGSAADCRAGMSCILPRGGEASVCAPTVAAAARSFEPRPSKTEGNTDQ